MWDGFPLAGPGIVFFADFGGAAHSVAITTGHCTRMAGSADLRVATRRRAGVLWS